MFFRCHFKFITSAGTHVLVAAPELVAAASVVHVLVLVHVFVHVLVLSLPLSIYYFCRHANTRVDRAAGCRTCVCRCLCVILLFLLHACVCIVYNNAK